MKAIQILMDKRLLEAVDSEARRQHTDRSKLLRAAAARYLAELRRQRLEEQDRAAYRRKPQRRSELSAWEGIQSWPED